jgi:16S rRNA (guanine527-N7)-methyltransferase
MTPRELLISGAGELGISLTLEQLNSLFIYSSELRKWNRKINLTSITNERDVIIKHFLDSLSYLKGFAPAPGLRLLDMGSGAGFPAIPLKIACPELSVTLVESVKKKASFLRHIIRTLPLDQTEVKDVRIEELPENSRKSYDVITVRAFSDIRSAAAAGVIYLKPGGVMVLSRGGEETADDSALRGLDVECEARKKLTLPHSDYKRVIWVLKKNSP